MKITTKHKQSCYGIPVILDNDGEVMDYRPGLTAALEALGWDRKRLATETGKSLRTIERYWQGQAPPAEVLNVLADALAAAGLASRQVLPDGYKFSAVRMTDEEKGMVTESGKWFLRVEGDRIVEALRPNEHSICKPLKDGDWWLAECANGELLCPVRVDDQARVDAAVRADLERWMED